MHVGTVDLLKASYLDVTQTMVMFVDVYNRVCTATSDGEAFAWMVIVLYINLSPPCIRQEELCRCSTGRCRNGNVR